MAFTLVIPLDRISLKNVQKNIRNEVNRGNREHLLFKEIPLSDHLPHLRQYRKRKHLLMLPFYRNDPRKFFAALTKEGTYCCSLGVYPFNGCLRIQAVSIDEHAPYYAFSWLIHACLKLAKNQGFRGLDLSSDGIWKRRWHPLEENDGSMETAARFGGPISSLVTRIYWLTERKTDPISRKIHAWMVKRWG